MRLLYTSPPSKVHKALTYLDTVHHYQESQKPHALICIAHSAEVFCKTARNLVSLISGASEPQPIDPMGFPPGLLPALVKEHLRTEDNYVPLEKREVERAGIPEAAMADSYLLARLDKFHAELQVAILKSSSNLQNIVL